MAISFGKVPGAGSSAPVQDETPAKPANATLVENKAETPNLPVPAPSNRPAVSRGFSIGTEDEDEGNDPGSSRVKYPFLNLVQPSSKEIKNVAPEGDFVLAKTVKIPAGSRVVIIGFGKTFYREKVKWGGKDESRTAYTLEDVTKAGGTPNWTDSIENGRNNGGSVKPWFMPAIKAALMIEKPEGADEAHFPEVVDFGNGVLKQYAIAFFEAKSTAYDAFYVELNSKRKTTNLFKGGWAARFIQLTTVRGKSADASFKPVPVVLEATPPRFLEIAQKAAAGF